MPAKESGIQLVFHLGSFQKLPNCRRSQGAGMLQRKLKANRAVIRAGDVGVNQAGLYLNFAKKALVEFVGLIGDDDLHRLHAIREHVLYFVHVPHPAGSDLIENAAIVANGKAAVSGKDGKFSVEFVECLAGCGSAPVMMCNEDFYEGVSHTKADEIMGGCK